MSRLIGLMVVRNESWILGMSMRVALQWVDGLVILNHNSTDRTADIIEQCRLEQPDRFRVLHVHNPLWHEMHHRQRTLEEGRDFGGTHFAIIDADELLTANLVQATRAQIVALDPHQAFTLPMIPMWRSFQQYRNDDSVWSKATLSLAFADGPGVTWKPDTDGNHFHKRFPDRINPQRTDPQREKIRKQHRVVASAPHMAGGGVMHLQFANWARLLAKHVWYRMTETVMYPGRKTAGQLNKMYDQALNEDQIHLSAAPPEWWYGYDRWMDHVNLIAEPWHIADCERMIEEHGRDVFAGLDLKGLV